MLAVLLIGSATEVQWAWNALGLLSIPILVALNGFFVAAEFGLVAVRKTRVEELVNQGVKGAKAVQTAIDSLDRYIAVSQLGITVASILLGWVGEKTLEQVFLRYLPASWGQMTIEAIAWGTSIFLVTFLHVVLGEQVPKMMALQTPDRASLWVAQPLIAFARVTRPLIVLMNGTTNLILRLCGYQPATGESMVHSVEELALLIEDTEEAGILDPDQAEFVQNVFLLSDKLVRDCMVPRDKMAMLELNAPPDKVLEAVRRGAHTRMPVYEGDLDHIVGIVNTKDLFYLFSLRGVVVLDDALYPSLFLKPEESVANALRLFRKTRRPMALVRDDDGKIHGLITLEDILEEIVGDIEDEHDRPTAKLPLRRKRLSASSTPSRK